MRIPFPASPLAARGLLLAGLLALAGCPSTPAPVTCDPACPASSTCIDGQCVPNAPGDMAGVDQSVAPECEPPCSGATKYCSANRVCVACLTDDNCPAGQVCQATGRAAACVPGCATDDRCRGSAAGATCCTKACVDTATDSANCGGCGKACSTNNASSACTAGTCKLGPCKSGFGDCNMDPADGCEANLHTDPANCTACGMACTLPHAIVGCSDKCYLRACQFGYDDCNGDEGDGCETPVAADLKNCGACGAVCPVPAHAVASCVNGACGIGACQQGFFDCDLAAGNGCETQIATDVNNCGACGKVCPQGQICANGGCTCPNCNLPHAMSACVNNVCTLLACVPGYGDCDAQVGNGCEVDLNQDVNNCSKCGMACGGGMTCNTGACKMISCMRLGWKSGSANWACPNGLRMPTVNEWNSVAPCILQQDMAMFGYYNDVAVSVGGCNCKWNGGWCGQPSIETIRGGRMCGDYQQLHICVN